jgi:cytochrome c oxidase subunit III
MATTVHEPPKIDEQPPISIGGGPGGKVPSYEGRLPAVKDYAPPPSSTAIWVLVGSISMTFLALTSALIVRQAAVDWRHLTLPPILYFNTVVLISSSIALEFGRHCVTAFMSTPVKAVERAANWLYISLGLGLLFVAGQYVAWLQLRSQGLYVATNPNSSFFYVLTALHAVHVLGGLGGLVRVISRLNRSVLRKSTLDATARYWHFMDVLWIYLLWLLWSRL